MKKPSNLIYGVNEKVPVITNIALGFQHIFVMFIAAIFPVVIVRELGSSISMHNAGSFVSLSLFSGGVITIIQALRRRAIGSGFFCPSISGPSYLNASLQAAAIGGLPMVMGMTAFVGIVEMAFSRVMNRLRALFPPEVTGTIVALVGIVVVPLSVKSLVGIGFDDNEIEAKEVFIGITTLAVLVGLNVFSKGRLRLFCTIIGMLVGYLLSLGFGAFDSDVPEKLIETSLFALPYIENISWRFDLALLIPFSIAALSSTLKTVGDISTCQRINDSDWKRVDMKSVKGGILVDGMGGLLPGLIGGFGQSTSSTNIGLSVATGATSRFLAFSSGGLLIALAFFPKLAYLFIIMPKPVMGALLIFSVSFIIVQGLQMVMSRMLDSRKIFVVGISIVMGLSADMVPQLYAGIHPFLQPVFSSSLSLGAVCVVFLNLIMRIGIKQKAFMIIDNEALSNDDVVNFIDRQGRAWGARPEVFRKLTNAANELVEKISRRNSKHNPSIELCIKFDEFKVEAVITYEGKKIDLDFQCALNQMNLSEGSVDMISDYLIFSYVDNCKVEEKNGWVKIHLSLEH
jgi:NCS2 family nucleobase:cation symporter-2